MKFFNDEIVNKIRKGYYSAVYFNRTKEILLREKNFKKVTMQIFQKNEESILCGVEEVVELLKVGTGYWDPPSLDSWRTTARQSPPSPRLNRDYGEARWIDKISELKIGSLNDGDRIGSWETVMHITGPYAYFAHLESLYLGILARRTLVATNVRKVVEAAAGKQVIFFADRFDHFLNQEGDGFAAKLGGASVICTQAMSRGFGKQPVGTIPHSFIAVNNGDTVETARQFAKQFPDVNLIVLVDFDNDCVRTSLEVARALGKKLWGVRLDTAENMIDVSLQEKKYISHSGERSDSRIPSIPLRVNDSGQARLPARQARMTRKSLYGVNPRLVRNVREALDKEEFKHIKIVVSGGFNEEKIRWFEKEKTPVDAYGVGSALVHGENDFTADVVKVEDKLISKVGRKFKANRRMKHVI